EGPFAGGLDGSDNLILKAVEAARALAPGLKLGQFRLMKTIPVAAGLGGGSADAAVALRLLAGANPGALAPEKSAGVAAELGSDVNACLQSKPVLMTGRGEKLAAVSGFPTCGVLLANPGVELPTADVYAASEAPQLNQLDDANVEVPDFQGSFERLVDYV